MSLEFTEESLKKAFCDSLACTGIGAARANCDALMSELVKKVVPLEKQEAFPEELQICATRVCTSEPYGWRVMQRPPVINDASTFQNLFDAWFTRVVRPPVISTP